MWSHVFSRIARCRLMHTNTLAADNSRISGVAFSLPALAQRTSTVSPGVFLLTKSHLVLLVWELLF